MPGLPVSPLLSDAAPAPARVRVWDLPLRLFHWLLVATILIAFLSSEEDSVLSAWHVPVGWFAAVLIAFRLVWGFVGGEHARFSDFLKPGRIIHHVGGLFSGKPERSLGHNALGGIAILALLGTTAGIVFTGATMRGEAEGGLHETLTDILLVLIGMHGLAVIAMSLLTRDNLVGAMMTGTKRAALHPDATDARPPMPLALPVAAIAVAASAYAATTFDPQAFSPSARADAGDQNEGKSEKGEHGDE